MRNIDHIIVHCSATKPSMDIGAEEIDRWHRERGWLGNGYHYIIRRDGRAESHTYGQKCRPLDKAGAHVGECGPGWNKRSIGICLIGGMSDEGQSEDNFTSAQLYSLESLVVHLLNVFIGSEVLGHRDLIKKTGSSIKKDCPCFNVRKFFLCDID